MPTVNLALVAYAFLGLSGAALLVFFARGIRQSSTEVWSAWPDGGTATPMSLQGFPYPFGSERIGTTLGPAFFGRRWRRWIAVLAVGTTGLAALLAVHVGELVASGGSLISERAPEQILLTGGSPEALRQTLVGPPPGDWIEVPETGLHGPLSRDDVARAFPGRAGVDATDQWLRDTGFAAGYARSLGDPSRGQVLFTAVLEFASAEGAETALVTARREDNRSGIVEGLSDIPALPGAYHGAVEDGAAQGRIAVLRRGAHMFVFALGGADRPTEQEILDLAYLQYGHLDEIKLDGASV